MLQFVADQIDQLDLALDQLAVRDRNFDRFAMMLIDNVVELTLHKHAQEKARENEMWRHASTPRHDANAIAAAIGPNFDAKVRFARNTGLLSDISAQSIKYLHGFRNTTYHQGRRHEGILHALAVLYLKSACTVLSEFKPVWWSSALTDKISHRAIKYLGRPKFLHHEKALESACARLLEVADAHDDTLVSDLATDMDRTIESTDEEIDFLTSGSMPGITRDEAVVSVQVWPFAFSIEGKTWSRANGYKGGTSINNYIDWLTKHYPWPIRYDPVPSWSRRADSLRRESDSHAALKKYCDFMKQTEDFRSQLHEAAVQLDSYIQHQIDVARGK